MAWAAHARAPAYAVGEEALSESARAHLEQALVWIRSVENLEAEFYQVSSNGFEDQGQVWVSRPNRARFEYENQPLLLLADGINWVIYDREEKTKTIALLSASPLSFLLRREPDLKQIRVVGVREDADTIEIGLEDADRPEAGRVTLIFSLQPFVLRGWRLIDPQGIHTRVGLFNLRTNLAEPPGAGLFRSNDLEVKGARDPNR